MEKINKLKGMGFSKWKIAKYVGVAWHTIHMWDKDVFKPTKNNEAKLDEMLKNKQAV